MGCHLLFHGRQEVVSCIDLHRLIQISFFCCRGFLLILSEVLHLLLQLLVLFLGSSELLMQLFALSSISIYCLVPNLLNTTDIGILPIMFLGLKLLVTGLLLLRPLAKSV